MQFDLGFPLTPLIRAIPLEGRRLLVGKEVTGLFPAEKIVLLNLHKLGLVPHPQVTRFRLRKVVTIHRRRAAAELYHRRKQMAAAAVVGSGGNGGRGGAAVVVLLVQNRARVAVRRAVFEIGEVRGAGFFAVEAVGGERRRSALFCDDPVFGI